MLKDRAKLHRDHSARKVYSIGKRLSSQVINKEEEKQNGSKPEKRKNMGSVTQNHQKQGDKDEKMILFIYLKFFYVSN